MAPTSTTATTSSGQSYDEFQASLVANGFTEEQAGCVVLWMVNQGITPEDAPDQPRAVMDAIVRLCV